MINLSVLYPNREGAKFDMDYYLDKHIPLVRERAGAALKTVSIEQGFAGGAPDSPPAFLAIVHLGFESLADIQSSVGPHTAELMADVRHFTNVEPTLQIGETKP